MCIFHNKIINLTSILILIFCISCTFSDLSFLEISEINVFENFIQLKFSDQIEKNKIMSNFEFTKDNIKISGDFEVRESTVKFYPYTDLNDSSNYRITILNTMESKHFNSLEKPFIYEFNNFTKNDFYYIDYKFNDNLEIFFNANPDLKSFQDCFSVYPSIDYYIHSDCSKNSVCVIFKTPLIKNQNYCATISKGMSDINKNKTTEKTEINFKSVIDNQQLSCKVYTSDFSFETENKVYEKIDSSKKIFIEFNNIVEFSNIDSLIEFIPPVPHSISLSPNKKIAEIEFNKTFYSENKFLFLIKKIKDKNNNQLEQNKCYNLIFNNERNHFPTINKLLVQNSENSFFEINSSVEIPFVDFDRTYFLPGTTVYDCKLIAIFDLFDQTNKIDIFSMMRNFYATSTNNCIHFKPMKIYNADKEFILLNNLEINQNQQVIVIEMDINNNNTNGLVKFKFGKSLECKNKINLSKDITYTFNKL